MTEHAPPAAPPQPADRRHWVPPAWLSGRRVAVAGVGVSGVAMARALTAAGADVVVLDERAEPGSPGVEAVDRIGADLVLGPAARDLPGAVTLVATSPGWRPDSPLLVDAAAAGLPVWGEVELAWRLRGDHGAPWLSVTGTNGKTTTVRMLAAMLGATGARAVAVGNVGDPVTAAVVADPPFDVLAVELSSFQLHWSQTVRPLAGALLNLAPDHIDWHGSFERYADVKARVWAGGVAVGNADDPEVAERLARAPGFPVPFTLGPPERGSLGVAGVELVDAAFADPPAPFATVAEVRPSGSHNVANALAAAALARAWGASLDAVRTGLLTYVPDRHRNEPVATVRGVAFVDDSKATNPHAAERSLAAYPSVVWIAGGLDKGLEFEGMVAAAAPRLRAAVLIGSCRPALRAALARHAPQVPVLEVAITETGAMREAVRQAVALAQAGDTVLLAPAAASMDMFRDYAARGDAFVAAVRELAAGPDAAEAPGTPGAPGAPGVPGVPGAAG